MCGMCLVGLQQLFGYKYRPDITMVTKGFVSVKRQGRCLEDTGGLCLLASENGAMKHQNTHRNAQEGHVRPTLFIKFIP